MRRGLAPSAERCARPAVFSSSPPQPATVSAAATASRVNRVAGHPPGCNGQPEETTTRHQPASIPSSPKRGRTCQSRQPGSPMSAVRDPHPAVAGRVGQHLLHQPPVVPPPPPGARRARAASSARRCASASLQRLELAQREQRGRTARHAGAATSRCAATRSSPAR